MYACIKKYGISLLVKFSSLYMLMITTKQNAVEKKISFGGYKKARPV
jgi:hypothetical protein